MNKILKNCNETSIQFSNSFEKPLMDIYFPEKILSNIKPYHSCDLNLWLNTKKVLLKRLNAILSKDTLLKAIISSLL